MKTRNVFRFIVLGVMAFMLSSCDSLSTIPKANLVLVEVNGSDYGVVNSAYIDDIITINWRYITKDRLGFKLKNSSSNIIKVLWDNGAYIDIDGSSNRIIHKNVKFINKDESQHPTTISSNAFIDDLIMPTNIITFDNVFTNSWRTGSLVSGNEEQLSSYYGEVIKVILPIEVNQSIIYYSFSFEIRPLN